ncbi:hypothetical protein BV22DRAFT_1107242 [Leucogyrophana mollusca]|uniref:Uncharacterized protein n=1 Tax=Leucogyrophana mollusca TaxID=85980 RepID=A0ACB8B6L6_9AGAM|nr:hypothetical protein BV22DRAFT_1107242 [Leucogyrophana mollusca]
MSRDHAFATQNKFPEGATVVGIVAASNKTPVTRHTGDVEMHPTFLTLANIHSEVRMKATAHAWRCVAYVPVVEFEAPSECQLILQGRLWHKCMNKVFVNLKTAVKIGHFMPDPYGALRYGFTPLVRWQGDLVEKQSIAVVAKNASPVSQAVIKQFGDNFPHPPRNGSPGEVWAEPQSTQ